MFCPFSAIKLYSSLNKDKCNIIRNIRMSVIRHSALSEIATRLVNSFVLRANTQNCRVCWRDQKKNKLANTLLLVI